ncbi:MAG: periplasmic heavy metal sensor [Elusimicrobia bacterium]|nr:periplasmic heavy metal sensor [Elusimicrobiota bacterium]MBD3411611.1 periplasmic heavy metal sensor [Elusimicrobiota bacterium]
MQSKKLKNSDCKGGNNMNLWKLVILITGVVVIATSITWVMLLKTTYPGCFCNVHPEISKELIKRLDLSDEQKEQIKKIEKNSDAAFKSLTTQHAQVRLLLCDLLKKSSIETADIEKYANEIGRLTVEEERLTIDQMIQIRNILNPDQTKEFFNAIMTDICTGCCRMTGTHECQCGLCERKQK